MLIFVDSYRASSRAEDGRRHSMRCFFAFLGFCLLEWVFLYQYCRLLCVDNEGA